MPKLYLLAALMVVVGCSWSQSAPPEEPASTVPGLRNGPSSPIAVGLTASENEQGVLLTATVEVHGRLPGSLTIALETAPGTRLVEGEATEVLDAAKPGSTVVRRYLLADLAGQVRVIVDARGARAGFRAHAAWPHVSNPQRQPPQFQKIPPIQLHGVKIEEAVPVGKTQSE